MVDWLLGSILAGFLSDLLGLHSLGAKTVKKSTQLEEFWYGELLVVFVISALGEFGSESHMAF